MQTILPMVLVGALGVVVAGLAALGLLQRLRRLALERRANEGGLHFCAEDTFDVPRRCAAFALCSAGHSPQASIVTYGRLRGLPVRAFDFRYEVAHGPHRGTRHCGVVLVEEPASPGVLMWNLADAAHAPAAALPAQGTVGHWAWRGDGPQARRLADLCESLGAGGLSLEARPEGVLFSFPMRRRRDDRQGWLEALGGLLDALGSAASNGPPVAAQNEPAQAVENPPPPC